MEATTLRERALEGARKFLVMRGYEILDEDYTDGDDQIDFIVHDDDAIAFIDFELREEREQGMPKERPDRGAFERIAASWLAKHQDDVADIAVRNDILSMLILGESRALIRHHINCLSAAVG